MKSLRCAIIGTGYWANYQLPAWLELKGIEIVALYNRSLSKAQKLAEQYHIPGCYDDIDRMLHQEMLDVVDIITDVDTHSMFVTKAAAKGIHVICQKPMAPDVQLARNMVKTCKDASVHFFVHENFRWQAPIRKLNQALQSGIIGEPFKARITFCSAFPVFENQPFLATIRQFILTDIGSHVLDICRFLFGEADSLYCQTATVNPMIKGEDVANVLIKMNSGVHCYVEMSYASILEKEVFPQTLILIEGTHGSISLGPNYVMTSVTRLQTQIDIIPLPMYEWVDPAYALVQSSIVACNRDILHGLQGDTCEMTGEDNLKTVELVHACYDSARMNTSININSH